MRSRPRILLTNDDGIASPGLRAMINILEGIGRAFVVAPAHEMSGVGHAITLKDVVEAEPARLPGAEAAYAVYGTPADCAKLAIRTLTAGDPPALCVSGLNVGPNVGVNVFYSGTVGAALEAAVNGVQAVAVSKEFGERLSLNAAARVIAPVIRRLLENRLPDWHILNVNVPDLPEAELRGLRLTCHGVSGFDESYMEEGPVGPRRRFRLTGAMCIRDTDGLTDAEAVSEGFISVTPMSLELTSRRDDDLRRWSGLLEGL